MKTWTQMFHTCFLFWQWNQFFWNFLLVHCLLGRQYTCAMANTHWMHEKNFESSKKHFEQILWSDVQKQNLIESCTTSERSKIFLNLKWVKIGPRKTFCWSLWKMKLSAATNCSRSKAGQDSESVDWSAMCFVSRNFKENFRTICDRFMKSGSINIRKSEFKLQFKSSGAEMK